MILRGRFGAYCLAAAIAVSGLLGAASCASHPTSKGQSSVVAGLPVYPNATVIGANSDALAIYRSADSYRTVADWYGAHMPRGTQTSRDDARSQATFAVFSPADTKTVHVEISDGTVRITLTEVKSGPAPPTGR
jgi:hypothetical protein